MINNQTIDTYISTFPPQVQALLQEIRATIHAAAPQAQEAISYGMPAFKFNGKTLVYFAAWTKHIGLYAMPSGNAAFQKRLARYKSGKGSVQFPLSQPMPHDLIESIVKFRVQEIVAGKKKR